MITSLYAALLAILFIALSLHVIHGRYQFKIALSTGNNDEMTKRIRAHGNLAEYAPLFLIMLALAEMGKLPHYMIHGLGILFLLGRLCHAYSLTKGEHYKDGALLNGIRYRSIGMVTTFATIGILAVILLVQNIMGNG